jgi:hypothetical protein
MNEVQISGGPPGMGAETARAAPAAGARPTGPFPGARPPADGRRVRTPLMLKLLIALFAFIAINAPSIKLIYSSELINIAAVACLWGLGFMKTAVFGDGRLEVGKLKGMFLLLFTAMWVLLLFYAAVGPYSYVGLKLLLQYLGVYAAVVGLLIILTHPTETQAFLALQMAWAVALAAVQLTVGVTLSHRQHYLTLGVPLAAGLVTLFGVFLAARSGWARLLSIPPAVVVVLALTTLLGRSPILFSSATIALYWLFVILTGGSWKTRLRQLLLFAAVGAGTAAVIVNNVSDHWMSRLRGLENVEEEPRTVIYEQAFDLINENPLGYGLNSADLLIGIYPHNIFLETLLSGGIGTFAALTMLIGLFAAVVLHGVRLQRRLLPYCMLASYFLLTWNVSFELSNAFTPLGAMAICLAAHEAMSRAPDPAVTPRSKARAQPAVHPGAIRRRSTAEAFGS